MNELIVTDSISSSLLLLRSLPSRNRILFLNERERERVKRPISPRDNERDDAVNSWRQV